MRIIGFSSATTPSFWTLSVQALTPWMSRIRHSLEQVAPLPATPRAVYTCVQARGPEVAAASNDAVFAPARPQSQARRTAPASLRVVRESDPAIGAECAGRMVISGRMADVCAELDRMALRAAAAQDSFVTTRR